MPRWLADIPRRPLRPLASVAAVALAPKCALCVLAYAGVGAALGLRGQEICGAAAGTGSPWRLSLSLLALALACAAWFAAPKGERGPGRPGRVPGWTRSLAPWRRTGAGGSKTGA
jgi:hypothetical protein